MNDLTVNEKLQVARLKSFASPKEEFYKLDKELQKNLIRKGYYDPTWNWLSVKCYDSYDAWFEAQYVGSKKERMDYDYGN